MSAPRCDIARATIAAKMITEMRGADFIVFELMKDRNIRNLIWTYFFEIN